MFPGPPRHATRPAILQPWHLCNWKLCIIQMSTSLCNNRRNSIKETVKICGLHYVLCSTACKIDPDICVGLILFREIDIQKAIDNVNLYMCVNIQPINMRCFMLLSTYNYFIYEMFEASVVYIQGFQHPQQRSCWDFDIYLQKNLYRYIVVLNFCHAWHSIVTT